MIDILIDKEIYMALWRFLTPIIAILVLCFIGFFYFVNTTIKNVDHASLEDDRRIINTQLFDLAKQLEILAVNTAWWYEAYDKIFIEPDFDWIGYNFGTAIADFKFVTGTVIYTADSQILFSKFLNDEKIETIFSDPKFLTYLSTYTADDLYHNKSDTAMILSDGRAFMIGISMVQSSGIENQVIPKERRPVAIFISELTQVFIEKYGTNLSLNNMALVVQTGDRLENSLKLDESLEENKFGDEAHYFLQWSPNMPGSTIFSETFPALIMLLSIILAALFVIVKHSSTLIQQHKSANKAKSEFLALMSHELRTPLNAIIGFSEVIKATHEEDNKKDANQEYLGHIIDSGHHLLSLINDILDFSKIEAKKWELFYDQILVAEEIESCVSSISSLVDNKKIDIDFDLAQSTIISDVKVFRHVTLNILSNAIKFTPEGGQIKIKEISEANYTIIEISDNGIGMAKDELEYAMKQFTQVQKAYTRDHNGTGLGLPLVFKFMELVNGKVQIKSAKDIGTTVSIYFPEENLPIAA